MVKNIIANVVGRFWSILSNFLFIPLYIHFLGFENFSIISFTLILTGIMAILDAGMTATLSREFARGDVSISSMKEIFSTLEKVYLAIVGVILFMLILFADFIANKWINVNSDTDLSFIIRVVGFDIGFQMLLKFYMGGLLGAGQQVKANLYQILWGVCRNALIVVVIYIYPTLNMFVFWQAFSTILFTLIFRVVLTKAIFSDIFLLNSIFKIKRLKDIGSFALGMLLISIVSAISTQLDKMIISKMLPISELGYYTISISIAMGLVVIVNPLATASLPKFTNLFSTDRISEAKRLFLNLNTLTSLVIVSILSMLVIFSRELIWIWTGDVSIAKNSSLILSIIAFGYAALAISLLPNNICIANAYTKYNNYLGIFSVLVTIPGYLMLVKSSGVVGAALIFSIVQVLVAIIFMILVNKKYLKIQSMLIKEIVVVILPLIMSVTIFKIAHIALLAYSSPNRVFYLIMIGFVLLIVLFLNFLFFVSKEQKESVFSTIKLPYAK